MTTLHYAAGGGLDSQGNFTAGADGFNLADIEYADQANALPSGVQGLAWLDQYHGVTQDFINQVTPFLNNPKVFGFYLVDEPDPSGQSGPQASAADLMAESDWIHQHDPGAKTFTVLDNMGTSDNPSYDNTYNAANTHIDYFGLDWYPVWSDRSNVDLSTIDKYVAAAEHAGIPLDSIVPVYQAFGGGSWTTETGSQQVMPTAEQAQAMINHWADLVPNPAFDYAYAWGSQNGDTALENSPELQKVFLAHNTSESTSTSVPPAGSAPIAETPTDTPVSDHSGSSATDGSTSVTSDAGGSTATDGSTTPVADAGGSTVGSTASSTPTTSPTEGTTPVSGSDGTTGTSTGGTTDTGHWNGHGHWSADPSGSTTADTGGHSNHGGSFDFSQWINGATSPSSADHGGWRGLTTMLSSATSDPTTDQTASWDSGSFVGHLADFMTHHNDHHAWHS